MTEMAIDLSDSTGPLFRTLEQAADQNLTGVVRVAALGQVHLNEGRVVLGDVPSSPSVAALLFASGYRDLEAVDAAATSVDGVTEMVESGDEAAEATLLRLAWEQTLGALFELSLHPDEADIEPGEPHPLSNVLAFKLSDLSTEVEARRDVWRRIATAISSTDSVFRMRPEISGPERVVTSEEWRVMAMLDGNTTVADVIEATGQSAFRVCSVLYRLLVDESIFRV